MPAGIFIAAGRDVSEAHHLTLVLQYERAGCGCGLSDDLRPRLSPTFDRQAIEEGVGHLASVSGLPGVYMDLSDHALVTYVCRPDFHNHILATPTRSAFTAFTLRRAFDIPLRGAAMRGLPDPWPSNSHDAVCADDSYSIDAAPS
jgi:hypothetical protein